MFSFKNYTKNAAETDKPITDRRVQDDKVKEIVREIARKKAKEAGEAAQKGEI